MSKEYCKKRIAFPSSQRLPKRISIAGFLGKSVINNFIQSEARKDILYLAFKKKKKSEQEEGSK